MINLAGALAAWVACGGWPALGRTVFAYALAARIPVAIVMLVALSAKWETHYELGPPGFPDLVNPWAKWILIGLVPSSSSGSATRWSWAACPAASPCSSGGRPGSRYLTF